MRSQAALRRIHDRLVGCRSGRKRVPAFRSEQKRSDLRIGRRLGQTQRRLLSGLNNRVDSLEARDRLPRASQEITVGVRRGHIHERRAAF